MKLEFTLLAVSLATSVSANSYTLCCCTKPTNIQDLKDPQYWSGTPPVRYNKDVVEQCNHAATKSIVDAMYGHFAFSYHFWVGQNGTPRLRGPDYIYATGINGDDSHIGQDEMRGWCGKVKAGRYCWTPDDRFNVNYKGDRYKEGHGGIP
ncbi:hypothetical protein EG328_010351 [Venturia inaequalis]|uniref:Uncharacterized protein n=1 Tax=Venturia inaequalis TaxID=5025 RepID=A0A8H3U6N3_VENIN|nr:hypothetical protein EG328_010351 [Venturia inaequalis]